MSRPGTHPTLRAAAGAAAEEMAVDELVPVLRESLVHPQQLSLPLDEPPQRFGSTMMAMDEVAS